MGKHYDDHPGTYWDSKRSVNIGPQHTSICLEDVFWFYLRHLAEEDGVSINEKVTEILTKQTLKGRSRFVRCYLMAHLMKRVPPNQMGLFEGTYDFTPAPADH